MVSDTFIRLAGVVAGFAFISGALAQELKLPLVGDSFEHIQFGKIQPNRYQFENGVLRIEVDDSASFLMRAFEQPIQLAAVRFQWRNKGELRVRDAAHESRRDGDDALFKLGLLLPSEAAWPNPFVPKWLKRVQNLLTLPSENMLNLVVGARHRAGERWSGPYSSRVQMFAVASQPREDGWRQAQHIFQQPLQVIAVWLMADGDNTASRFSTEVRNIVFDLADQR